MFILYKEILTTETSQKEVDSQVLSEENNLVLNPPDLAEGKVTPILIGHNAIVYGSLCMAFPGQIPFRVITEDDHEDSDWDGIGCRVLCGVVPVYVLKKFVFPKKYELQSIF